MYLFVPDMEISGTKYKVQYKYRYKYRDVLP